MSDFETGDREPLDAQLERDLAALADGSIDPERRSELERRLTASPRLQALLDEQMRAIALSRRGNRHAKTVFYARNGRRIGYTIVSGPALPVPSKALRLVRDGTDLQSDRLGDRVVVTWTREGHTCVLAGAGVAPSQLVELGAWKA